MPGLKAAEIDGRLEAAGIDKVYVFCVNDGAVMKAWKKDMGLEGSDLIEFLADTHGDLTEALGLTLTGDGKAYAKGEGPNKSLGFHTKRCKRSAMYVSEGVIKVPGESRSNPLSLTPAAAAPRPLAHPCRVRITTFFCIIPR